MPHARRKTAVLLLALAAAASLAAWVLSRASPARPVEAVVRVLDLAGEPVPGAQVEARYAPGWRAADAAGRVELADVPVREGEARTPATLAAAIDVRAPFYGRRGRAPEVRSEAAGGPPEVTFRLEAHGVVRVILPVSRFQDARAWVVADPEGSRVEALDGVEVARAGSGAAWRIFPGLEQVEIRLEGAEGMAWRRVVIPPPTPGFLREIAFVPERANPISGVVTGDAEAPEGSLPPVSGRIEVWELLETGERRAMDPVRVAPDGAFTVPYAGPGRYVLKPVLDLYEGPAEIVASGGAFLEERGAKPRPWIRLRVDGLGESARAGAAVTATGPDGGSRLLACVRDGETWHVAVKGADPLTLQVSTPGTNDEPPKLAISHDVAVLERGPTPVQLEAAPAPHGRLLVRLAAVPPRGAVVEVGEGRKRTLLPGLPPLARFPHVAVGPVVVRATDSAGSGQVEKTVAVLADQETTVLLEIPAAEDRGPDR